MASASSRVPGAGNSPSALELSWAFAGFELHMSGTAAPQFTVCYKEPTAQELQEGNHQQLHRQSHPPEHLSSILSRCLQINYVERQGTLLCCRSWRCDFWRWYIARGCVCSCWSPTESSRINSFIAHTALNKELATLWKIFKGHGRILFYQHFLVPIERFAVALFHQSTPWGLKPGSERIVHRHYPEIEQ